MRHNGPVEFAPESPDAVPQQGGAAGSTDLIAGRRGMSAGALARALFDGLSAEDREWVLERIRHYRALAAADQAPEGRF